MFYKLERDERVICKEYKYFLLIIGFLGMFLSFYFDRDRLGGFLLLFIYGILSAIFNGVVITNKRIIARQYLFRGINIYYKDILQNICYQTKIRNLCIWWYITIITAKKVTP